MNAKLLFVATVVLSIASALAMADESGRAPTREQAAADLQQAPANDTLQRTDCDADQITIARRALGHAVKPILANGRDDAKTGG